MKEEKLLFFLVLVVSFAANECKDSAFSQYMEIIDAKSDVNADIFPFQYPESIRNSYGRKYWRGKRKKGNLEKRNKQEGGTKRLLHQLDYNKNLKTNENSYVAMDAMKRISFKANAKDSGSTGRETHGLGDLGSSKRITLWSLEGLSDDFPSDLQRLAADQGEKIGDEALPSLVRNIEPTDYRAYAQYKSLSEAEGDAGSDLKKNKDQNYESLANKRDTINHVKKSTKYGAAHKSIQRNKKREIKKSDEAKQDDLHEPISNAAGTNELGLIEIEREQESNEDALRKKQKTNDTDNEPQKPFH